MSEHPGRAGVPHLVLERARIAERWRTGRWDSLVTNGPAWHDRFTGWEFAGDPEAFPGKDTFADYFVDYADRIAANIARGDADYQRLLDETDAWARRNGLDLPPGRNARQMLPDPSCITKPVLAPDLAAAGITAIVWATGYEMDFGWLQVDAFDAKRRPNHQRGVSSEPGIYFLGGLARCQIRRRSHHQAVWLSGLSPGSRPGSCPRSRSYLNAVSGKLADGAQPRRFRPTWSSVDQKQRGFHTPAPPWDIWRRGRIYPFLFCVPLGETILGGPGADSPRWPDTGMPQDIFRSRLLNKDRPFRQGNSPIAARTDARSEVRPRTQQGHGPASRNGTNLRVAADKFDRPVSH